MNVAEAVGVAETCEPGSVEFVLPGEMARPLPEHVCLDHLRSGVAGGIFCAVCHEEFLA